MKTLSFQPPWSWLVAMGLKPIENRSKPTKFRGRFLIHASKSYDYQGDAEARERLWIECGLALKQPSGFVHGAIIGSVELYDCVSASPSPWFFGPFGYKLRNAIMFKKPIPCKGQLGFFDFDITGGQG